MVLTPRLPLVLLEGACIGKDPRLWDAVSIKGTEQALEVCRMCMCRQQCIAWMQPTRRFYTGVVGGRIYLNGVQVTINDRRLADSMIRQGDVTLPSED